MELTPKAQAVELIKQSNRILILTHADPDGDAVGSVLALRLALKKISKEVQAIFTGRVGGFSFLPGFEEVKSTHLQASNDLVISIDTRSTGEDLKLGYKKLSDQKRINIVITPPKGTLVPEDVTIERSTPKYDLVVLLDTATLDRLGSVYREFPDLFYETPTIVIDHHPTNAYEGKVNWVDMTAASTAEMLVSLLESLGRDEPIIDEEIATCLLTGLITDTGSFQNINTTPKSLTVAAQMVAAGARHQEIMSHLRSKKLSTLKLWGRALTNIRENREMRFVWTEVSAADYVAAGAQIGDDSELADELLKTVVDADFVFVLSERDNHLHCKLRSVNRNYDVSEIARAFGGGGHQPASSFVVDGTIELQRQTILNKMVEMQKLRPKPTA